MAGPGPGARTASSIPIFTTYWVNDDGSVEVPSADDSSLDTRGRPGWHRHVRTRTSGGHSGTITVYDNANAPVEGADGQRHLELWRDKSARPAPMAAARVSSNEYDGSDVGILSFTVLDVITTRPATMKRRQHRSRRGQRRHHDLGVAARADARCVVTIWTGVTSTNGSKWRATSPSPCATPTRLPVSGAKVYGHVELWQRQSTARPMPTASAACSAASSRAQRDGGHRLYGGRRDPSRGLHLGLRPGGNSDPDGDSDGTTIIMDRPVPTPMFVADLDGVTSTNGSKWRTNVTITVRDADQLPVAGAKVYGDLELWQRRSTAPPTLRPVQPAQQRVRGPAMMRAIGFTVDDVTHPEALVWAYDTGRTATPTGTATARPSSWTRPVPTPMFVVDLDGAEQHRRQQVAHQRDHHRARCQPAAGARGQGLWHLELWQCR